MTTGKQRLQGHCSTNTPLLPDGLGKGVFMEQNQNENYITLELNMKLQMRDYRLVLGLKRTWILAMVVGAIQLVTWFLKNRQ